MLDDVHKQIRDEERHSMAALTEHEGEALTEVSCSIHRLLSVNAFHTYELMFNGDNAIVEHQARMS